MTERTFKVLHSVRASSLGLFISACSGLLALCNVLKQVGLPVDKFPGVISSQRWRWIAIVLFGLASLFLLSLRFPRFATVLLRLLIGREPLPSDLPRLFRGPRPYSAKDGERFFGRRADVDECWRKLQQEPFLILEGESGCGKSSLVQAGLLSYVLERYVVREARVGDDPLAKVFGEPLGSNSGPLDEVDRDAFFAAIREATQANQPDPSSTKTPKSLLLILDQFEELFTTVRDEVRDRFVLLLKEGIQQRVFRLLIIIRTDYVDLLMRTCRELDREQETLKIGNYHTLHAFNEIQAASVVRALLAPVRKDDLIREQLIEEFSESLVRELLRPPRDKRVYVGDEKTVLPVELQIVGMIIENIGPEKFSAGDLRKLGGKLGLLRIYVQDAKDYVWRRTGEAGDLALLTLQALSPSEVRESFTSQAIAEALDISSRRAEAILHALSERYLVNKLLGNNGSHGATSPNFHYELMHEHLAQILDEAPDTVLHRERDARERLIFLAARNLGSNQNIEGAKSSSFRSIRVAFSQSIKLSEIISLFPFARSSDERRMLRRNLRAFLLKLIVVIVGMVLAIGIWLLRTRSDSYQIQRILADAPVAQTAANSDWESSNNVLDWTEALVRANRSHQIAAMIQQIENGGLQVEVLLTAAETSVLIGRENDGTDFFDLALKNARQLESGSRPAAIAAVALGMKRANLDKTTDSVFDEALNTAKRSPDADREGAIALVVQTMTEADRLEQALSISLEFKNVFKRDRALEDISRAYLRLQHAESALGTAVKIENYSTRSAVLAEVVKGLANQGQIDQALMIIPRIVQDDFRNSALSDLAEGMAEQGRSEDAVRTVRRIGVDDFTPPVMAEVLKARAEAKKWSISRDRPEVHRDERQRFALMGVATGLDKAGKKEEAKRIRNSVLTKPLQADDDELGALSNLMIAMSLLEAGDKDQARKSFDELLKFIERFKPDGDSQDDDDNALYGYLILLQVLLSQEDADAAENQFSQVLEAVKHNSDDKVKFELLSSMANFLTLVLSSNPSQTVSGPLPVAPAIDINKPKMDDVVVMKRLRTMAARLIDEASTAAYRMPDDKARLNAFVTISTLANREGRPDKATVALDNARQIAGSLRADSEISRALELVAEGFARLGSFRLARLTCETCSSSDKLKAYAFILNQFVNPNQQSLRDQNKRFHTRIAYSGII